MELKRVVTLAVFSVLLLAGFIVYFVIYLKQPPIQGYTISNRRDGHGCLIRSGYAWDNSSQSCIKELANKTIIYQIADFKSCLDAGYAINENNVTRQLQCQALNGTLFIDDSVKNDALSKEEKTDIKYPDNVTMVSNFTIKNVTNSS